MAEISKATAVSLALYRSLGPTFSKKKESDLMKEVLGNPSRYANVISEMEKAGLENPFSTQGVKPFVDNLLSKHSEANTEYKKAFLLMRAMTPSDVECVDVSRRVRMLGLKESEGGLEVRYNNYDGTPLRVKYGAPLPVEIINASKKERKALCYEKSELMIAMLRCIGIKANLAVFEKRNHGAVLAVLDGVEVLIDPSKHWFEKPEHDNKPIVYDDLRAIWFHYLREGAIRSGDSQKQYKEALSCFDVAERLIPGDKLNIERRNEMFKRVVIGNVLRTSDSTDYAEIMKNLQKRIEADKDDEDAWYDMGVINHSRKLFSEAIKNFREALRINPKNPAALLKVSSSYYMFGDKTNADKYFKLYLSVHRAWLYTT